VEYNREKIMFDAYKSVKMVEWDHKMLMLKQEKQQIDKLEFPGVEFWYRQRALKTRTDQGLRYFTNKRGFYLDGLRGHLIGRAGVNHIDAIAASTSRDPLLRARQDRTGEPTGRKWNPEPQLSFWDEDHPE
jgi:hypothetical protein